MTPSITATFETEGEAKAARAPLIAGGVDPAGIHLAEQRQGVSRGGLFDQLTEQLAPGRSGRPDAYVLTAEVPTGQLDAATRAIERPTAAQGPPAASPVAARLEDRTYEFIETAEELVIEKQLFVREEIVLTNRAHEHVEDVIDTVRRTEVEIERIEPDRPDKGPDLYFMRP